MAVITIQIQGDRDSLQNSSDNFKKGCKQGLRKSGQIVKKRIVELIKNPPKTGRKYSNLPNRSSQAGEAPAFQSGKLARSASYAVHRWDEMEVGVKEIYGLFLEKGTKKMKSRPFISTAASQTFQTVKTAINMHINQEIGAL